MSTPKRCGDVLCGCSLAMEREKRKHFEREQERQRKFTEEKDRMLQEYRQKVSHKPAPPLSLLSAEKNSESTSFYSRSCGTADVFCGGHDPNFRHRPQLEIRRKECRHERSYMSS